MLRWLQDIAVNGERFRGLQEKGKERIRRRIADLTKALGSLESETGSLKKWVEEYIQELTRTDTEVVRNSIQNSIIDLESQKE